MAETTYDAFISYRRSDGAATARWLRRELEGFRPPKSLRDKLPKRLRIYQDTAYERGTSDFYEHSVRPALMASRWLLVVATPNAVRRAAGAEDWIQREVEDFNRGPHAGNVVAVRGAGEFDDPLPADLARRFPLIEIVDLRGASRLWFLNPTKAARLANEKLKLVAPLMDLAPEEMPKLRQEEEKRQQARLGAAAGVTLATVVFVSAASLVAMDSRNRATRALESSMFATGRMVASAARLDRRGSGGEQRGRLLSEACDLLDRLRAEAESGAPIENLVTCRIERSAAHEELKETELARKHLDEAVALAAGANVEIGIADTGLTLIEARERLVEFLRRQMDSAAVEAQLELALADARRLIAGHPHRHEFPAAEGEALGQLGDISVARNERAQALERYEAAAEAVGRAAKDTSEPRTANLKIWQARLIGLAGEQQMQLGAKDGALESFRRAIDMTAGLTMTEAQQPQVDLQSGVMQAYVLDIERRRGNGAAADAARAAALAAAQRVAGSKHATADHKKRAAGLVELLAKEASAPAAAPEQSP